jgi:F420H(2)-dependent quinone reductase
MGYTCPSGARSPVAWRGVLPGDTPEYPRGPAVGTCMSELQGEYVPSTAGWVRDQVEAFEASGGAEANTLRGGKDPIVVITNRGAKTGKIRKTPLMRVERDGRYLAVGSKGGAPENPVWVHNFRANPEVVLQDGPEKKTYVARELSGEERARWWDVAVATWPTYGEYQKRTDRLIPLFLLEPVE